MENDIKINCTLMRNYCYDMLQRDNLGCIKLNLIGRCFDGFEALCQILFGFSIRVGWSSDAGRPRVRFTVELGRRRPRLSSPASINPASFNCCIGRKRDFETVLQDFHDSS